MLSSPPRSLASCTSAVAARATSPARLAEDARDLLVADHGGEAVRAEEEHVPGVHAARLDVDQQVGAPAEGAGDHVAQRVVARLLRRR